jgi:hypothetical protein
MINELVLLAINGFLKKSELEIVILIWLQRN